MTTYTGTLAPDSFSSENNTTVVKLMSISAMPFYIDKSHEELRCEDYHLGDKGGLSPVGGSGFGISTTQSSPLKASSVVVPKISPLQKLVLELHLQHLIHHSLTLFGLLLQPIVLHLHNHLLQFLNFLAKRLLHLF